MKNGGACLRGKSGLLSVYATSVSKIPDNSCMLLLRGALIQQMFSRLNEKLVRGQTRGTMAAESVASNYV
jgi:hypothetical protein